MGYLRCLLTRIETAIGVWRAMTAFRVRWDGQAKVYVAACPFTLVLSQGTTPQEAIAAAAEAGILVQGHTVPVRLVSSPSNPSAQGGPRA